MASFFVILMLGLNSFHNAFINLIGVQSLVLLYVFLVFSGSIGHRLVHFAITVCIIIGGEFVLAVLLGFPYYLSERINYIDMSSIAVEYFAMKLVTYLLFVVVKQMSGKAKEHIPNKVFGMYLCLPFSTIGILVLTYHSGVNLVEDVVIRMLLIICSFFMFVGNVLIFYAFHRHTEVAFQKSQLELMMTKQEIEWKNHSRMMEQNEERQKTIHDITNLLKVISGSVDVIRNREVANIVRDLNIDIEKNENKIYCQNSILNVLLSGKVAEANEKEIEMDIFVEPNIHLGKIREIDLITAIGNLLDNGIRGASECEEKSNVQVKIFIEKQVFIVKVTNKFDGKLSKREGRFLTTKENKKQHGLGIKSVEGVAERYGGSLTCDVFEKEFRAILCIPMI